MDLRVWVVSAPIVFRPAARFVVGNGRCPAQRVPGNGATVDLITAEGANRALASGEAADRSEDEASQ